MPTNGVSKPESTKLASDLRWAAVRKIAESPQFARATLLREFLLYISEHELTGHPEEITEQKIGHRVYKRNELYSPTDDNIVRVSAHQLRLKLREYYETEGKEEPWLIDIPKGKYIPHFRKRNESEEDRSRAQSPKIGIRAWVLAAIGLAIVAILAWPHVVHFAAAHSANTPSNLITYVFHNSNQPVEVVMSDEALVLMQSMLGHLFTLEDYSNQSYRNLPPALKDNPEAKHMWYILASRQLVNVGDSGVATRIRDSLLQLGASPTVEIKSAQNMRPRDFLSGNFILLGESSSNPWVAMFGENRFNFQFSPDIVHFPRPILNLHPKPGEQKYYAADLAHNLSYARIAYIPNVTNTGHALLIAGTSMEGTEAAAEFCLQPESVSILRRDLGVVSGQPLHAFELLLLTSSKGGAGIGARVISARGIPDSTQ